MLGARSPQNGAAPGAHAHGGLNVADLGGQQILSTTAKYAVQILTARFGVSETLAPTIARLAMLDQTGGA